MRLKRICSNYLVLKINCEMPSNTNYVIVLSELYLSYQDKTANVPNSCQCYCHERKHINKRLAFICIYSWGNPKCHIQFSKCNILQKVVSEDLMRKD